jgi:transcriptional regulator
MYTPRHFEESRTEVLHEFIRGHNFAALVTLGPEGLCASHIPFLLDPDPAPLGTLRAHIARANGQWRGVSPEAALVIFAGPHHYISPNWYPSKAEHGRVVPTWNYTAVHAYGVLRTFDDPEHLLGIVRDLTNLHESSLQAPWKVEDTPPGFIEGILPSIIGVEIPITRLEGKWKVSQNRPDADRRETAQQLRALGTSEGKAMARLVEAALSQ